MLGDVAHIPAVASVTSTDPTTRNVTIAQQAERIAELEAKEFDWAKANAKCTDAIAKQAALIEKCEKALIEARDDVYSELMRAKQLAGYKRFDDEIKRQNAQLVRHDEALAAIAGHGCAPSTTGGDHRQSAGRRVDAGIAWARRLGGDSMAVTAETPW